MSLALWCWHFLSVSPAHHSLFVNGSVVLLFQSTRCFFHIVFLEQDLLLRLYHCIVRETCQNGADSHAMEFAPQSVRLKFLRLESFIFRGNKLNTVLNGGEMLLDADWVRLSDQVSEDWADHLTETLALIGSTQKEGARLSGEVEKPVNVEEVFKNTVKWLSATTNSIDNEDAKIVERVSNFVSTRNRCFDSLADSLSSVGV